MHVVYYIKMGVMKQAGAEQGGGVQKVRELGFLLSEGDGIGPEITAAVLKILTAAGLALRAIPVEIGEKSYLAGHSSGISPQAWELLQSGRILLKAPVQREVVAFCRVKPELR
jgi:isocitrate/isopropylmalate dehydrogenase